MSITPILPATLPYVRCFNLICIVMIDGRLKLATNPGVLNSAECAWWCERSRAGRIIKLATAERIPVEAAAQRLGVRLAPHDHVVARAGAAVERIDSGITQAQERGDLQFFNRTYRMQRLTAQAAGRRFLTYKQARQRLANLMAECAAGARPTPSIVAKVFEDR
jgi:hypothetical protein